MFFVNQKVVLIDGWVVNRDTSCLLNPSTLVTQRIVSEQQFKDLIDRGLRNWSLLFIPESDLYCEYSEELFQYLSTKSHTFCELTNGSIKSLDSTKEQRPADGVSKTFSLLCHSFTLTDGRDVFIHHHMGPKSDLIECLNTDLVMQSKCYTAIAFNGGSFLDIDGFLVNLKSYVFCSLFSDSFQKEISVPVWLGLRSVSSASMFERLQASSLNYWLTDSESLFYVMHKKVYVNFHKKGQDNYVCQMCERENATNLALPVSTIVDNSKSVKFIVLSKKIQDYGPSLQDLQRPWEKESFSMDTNLYYHYPLMRCEFSDHGEDVEVPHIMRIPSREIRQLPSQTMQEVLKPEIHPLGLQKDIQRLRNTLFERMLKGGQWKIENIKKLFEYDPELEKILAPALPKYEYLHKKTIHTVLKTKLDILVEQLYGNVKNKDGEVIRDIKIVERFLVDIKERIVVSPKEAKYNFEDKIVSKYDLLDWSIFILQQQPIEIFSSKLFDSVQVKGMHDVDKKLNGRQYITLDFGKFGTICLIEGKEAEKIQMTEPLSVHEFSSPKFQFHVSELNGLLDVSKHLLKFNSLLKTVNEYTSQTKVD